MIYATTMSIEKYDVTMPSGNVHGLHASYGHYPAFLALVLIATPFGYDYEGSKPKDQCRVSVNDFDAFKETLASTLRGRTIEDLLKSLNPLDFYKYVNESPEEEIAALPLVAKAHSGDVELTKIVIGARAAAWASTYRGRLTENGGKVTHVAFGKGLPVPENLKLYDKHLKEEINGSK